jgi:outer membrane receptor for ferrienterochelin and colicins
MKRLLLILAISVCFVPFVFSQQESVTVEDIFNLVREGKVVTSTKTERLLKTVPHAVTVITRKQIEESGVTSLAEALRFVPGVNSRITPMGSQIGIRSFGSTPFSERVLFLIDGTPYNSPDKGGYPGHPAYEDFFPLEAVKRIEIIKGPGSALFGQNAFFGIINIITDQFRGLNHVIANGGSRNTGAGLVRGGGDTGDWTYTYLGKYKQQEGPMRFLQITNPNAGAGKFPIPPDLKSGATDVKSGDIYAKLASRSLAFSYLFHRDETGSFTWNKPRTAADFAVSPDCCSTFPTEQTLQFFDASYNHKFSNDSSWRMKAFYNRRNGNTCENCHNNIAGSSLLNEQETNQRFFVNTQYDLLAASHKIIFGADFQFDKTQKNIAQRPDRDPTIRNVAGYTQDEITLADGRFIATLGVRVDRNEITKTAVSPSASAVFLPGEKFIIRTLYGRAFRQPTWNDLFIETNYSPVSPNPKEFFGTGIREFRQEGNPNVDTEQIDTFEAGVEYFFDPTISAKVDTYFNHVKDLIEAYDFQQNPPGLCSPPCFFAQTKNLRNRDLNSRGFEIELRFKPASAFSAIVGYALQKNDFDAVPTRVDLVQAYSPEHKITATVDVRPVESLLFNLSLNHWSKYDTRTFLSGDRCLACSNTDEIGQPYTYANFRSVLTVPLGSNKLDFGFTIKNLFDEKLQLSHAFRVNAALFGREYFGTVQYEF